MNKATPSGTQDQTPSGDNTYATPSGKNSTTPSGPHSRQSDHSDDANKTPSGLIFFNTLVTKSFTEYTALPNIRTSISDNFTGAYIPNGSNEILDNQNKMEAAYKLHEDLQDAASNSASDLKKCNDHEGPSLSQADDKKKNIDMIDAEDNRAKMEAFTGTGYRKTFIQI